MTSALIRQEAQQRFGASCYIVGMTVGKFGAVLLSHKVGRQNRYAVASYRRNSSGVRLVNIRSGFVTLRAGQVAYRERVEG